ncbi:hypothetical protein ACUN24_05695 [Pedobacter sp. WC2501]|uniref:hypothetical protein n=1 Tax=Pedobacter sp. WC2501 TaxID=3461400 RepID=UPI00404546BA
MVTSNTTMCGGSINSRKIIDVFFEKQDPASIGTESPAIRFTSLRSVFAPVRFS